MQILHSLNSLILLVNMFNLFYENIQSSFYIFLGNVDFEVLITHVNAMPTPYKIPSFEVITLELRKVTCIVEGKECQGLIKENGHSTTIIGHYVCTSSCKITIDRDQYI